MRNVVREHRDVLIIKRKRKEKKKKEHAFEL